MEAVSGQQFQHAEARLPGFERFLLKDQIYPGVTHTGHNHTDGRVYFDLDQSTLERLDYFEDDYYVRQNADVKFADETRVKVFVYVIKDNQLNLLSDRPWDESRFVAEHLDEYLVKVSAGMERYNEVE